MPDEPVTLTTNPVSVLDGNASIVVGCEREADGTLRLYLYARHRGLFVRVPTGGAADKAEHLWNATTTAHIYLRPAPPADAIFSDTTEGPAGE